MNTDKPFFIFGFTSFIYENLIKKLDNKLQEFNFPMEYCSMVEVGKKWKI